MRKILCLLLIGFILCNSGCYKLRKKFVRKKKREKETPVYVDFKDYPNRLTKEAYDDYYIFVRSWLDELIEALRKGLSHKRQKRAINEAIMNTEQIITFFTLEGKDKIYPMYEELLSIKETLQKRPNASQMQRNSLIRKIEYFKRRFEKEFNYSDAKQWMS